MTTPQPDKTGMHILLKLASLVVILAGIHAAADIIVQLLLALFFAIVLNPLVTWFIRRGVRRPVAITIVVVVMLIVLTALIGVLAASVNEFVAMMPKYSKSPAAAGGAALFAYSYVPGAYAATHRLRQADDVHDHPDDRAVRRHGQRRSAGYDGGIYAF